MIKVSVIIPVYNVEKYIEKCLVSVLNQTLREIEIICVNDGTKDHSMEIIDRYAKQDDRIIIVNKDNGGLSSARNAGIRIAKGQFIYFIDSDDYIIENALEELYDHSINDRLDCIYFDAEAFFEEPELMNTHGHYTTYYKRPAVFDKVVSGVTLFSDLENGKWFRPSACLQMIRREYLINTGILFYEGIVHEDQLYTFQTMLEAPRVKHINVPYYRRRVRKDSIMTSENEVVSSYGYYVALSGCKEFIKDKTYSDEEVLQAIEKRLHALQNLAANAITTVPYYELTAVMKDVIGKELTLEEQTEYDLTIKRLVEEKQKRRSKETELKKQYEKKQKDIKSSASYRVGKAILKVPKAFLGGINYIRDKGFVCSLYRLKRTVFREKKKLSSDKILVSVIMPIYNVENYIRDSLNALVNQTLKSIEIICVNDGSTDGTLAILKEFEKKDNRIHVVDQENSGAGIARNNGMKNAHGEYMLFLDSDDIYEPNLCEEAYFKAKYEMADIVLFQAYRYDVRRNNKEKMDWVLDTKLLPKRIPFSAKSSNGKIYQITTACPWSKMFRSEFVRKAGLQFQDTKNANDVFFVRSALALAKRITVLKKRLITYRFNEGGNIQSGKSKAPLEFYKAFKALKEDLIKRGIFHTIEQSYVNMAMKETLFNYKTAGTDEAKEMIENKLAEEGNNFFEFNKYDKTYFYDAKLYDEYMERLGKKC